MRANFYLFSILNTGSVACGDCKEGVIIILLGILRGGISTLLRFLLSLCGLLLHPPIWYVMLLSTFLRKTCLLDVSLQFAVHALPSPILAFQLVLILPLSARASRART